MTFSSAPPIIFDLLPARRSADRLSVDPHSGGARKLHIRRLFDLLHLSLHRRDIARSQRIWSILIRCREVDFSLLWDLGLQVLNLPDPTPVTDDEVIDKHLDYLKACQNLSDRETAKVLLEYTCVLLSAGRPSDALDELQLYLSVPPCSQHAALHEYAGMIALLMAELPERDDTEAQGAKEPRNIAEYLAAISTTAFFGRAKAYFHRAQLLDPSSDLSATYLELMTHCSESVEGMLVDE